MSLRRLMDEVTEEELLLWSAYFGHLNAEQDKAMKKARRGRRQTEAISASALVATFPADILLQVKAKGVQQQLTKVENFFNRIDNKAKIVEQRLEKLRNPQGFRVAINDKAFDKVVQKSRKVNDLFLQSRCRNSFLLYWFVFVPV